MLHNVVPVSNLLFIWTKRKQGISVWLPVRWGVCFSAANKYTNTLQWAVCCFAECPLNFNRAYALASMLPMPMWGYEDREVHSTDSMSTANRDACIVFSLFSFAMLPGQRKYTVHFVHWRPTERKNVFCSWNATALRRCVHVLESFELYRSSILWPRSPYIRFLFCFFLIYFYGGCRHIKPPVCDISLFSCLAFGGYTQRRWRRPRLSHSLHAFKWLVNNSGMNGGFVGYLV